MGRLTTFVSAYRDTGGCEDVDNEDVAVHVAVDIDVDVDADDDMDVDMDEPVSAFDSNATSFAFLFESSTIISTSAA